MCIAMVRIVYQSSDPAQTTEYETLEAALARIEEAKKLDTVASVSLFQRAEKHQRTVVWETVK